MAGNECENGEEGGTVEKVLDAGSGIAMTLMEGKRLQDMIAVTLPPFLPPLLPGSQDL